VVQGSDVAEGRWSVPLHLEGLQGVLVPPGGSVHRCGVVLMSGAVHWSKAIHKSGVFLRSRAVCM
jgi:hypothetical protein